jgi:Tat protein translocase TatB subunit
MFDVGFGELVLISLIGLLVLGPQRLPKVAAEIGKWVGRARRTATQLRRQLEREIELSELQTPSSPPTPPPSPSPPSPATPAAQSSGEVPPGPGTHADQPDAVEPAPSSASSVPEQRAEQTPPS